MSTTEKLMQKIFSNSQVSYKEAEKILFHLNYVLTIRGSHYGFRKSGFRMIIIKRRAQLLQYQIKELQEILIDHGYQKK